MNSQDINFEYIYYMIIQGNNHDFSIEEFKALYSSYFPELTIEINQLQNTLYELKTQQKLPHSNHQLYSRITFIDRIFEHIAKAQDFSEIIEKLDLKVHKYSNSFRVDHESFKIEPKIDNQTLAYPLWTKLKHLSVDLKNPQHFFMYLYTPETLYLGEQIFKNQKTYLKRMPKLRPVAKPYTLKSDMARAGINLLKVKEQDTVLDPFCGICGILLEASDMNLKAIGNDINKFDIINSKKNYDYFKYEYPQFFTEDAQVQFLEENSVDGIISDIPYGKCSRRLGDDLYENFLKSAQKMLKPNKRMTIIYANFTNFKPLALKYFNEVVEIEEYMNKSMTRYVLVLENTKLK